MAVDPAAAMAPDLGPKVAIAPGGSDTSCTFVFLREDHTLGNTLRYILNQDPSVEFAGYSVPHPLQAVMHIHVQTLPNSGQTCSDAMLRALKQTDTLCKIISDKFDNALSQSS